MSSDLQHAVLEQAFSKNLDAITKGIPGDGLKNGVAVAYSGGLDSTVLLELAIRYCRNKQLPLSALHIHHGLSPNADAWLEHCQSVCKTHDIPFLFARIQVASDSRDGIEASARMGRYQALGRFAQEMGIGLILTAHHQDDQAETLLLQMLRGSGVAGMSGMDVCNKAPNLFGHDALMLGRPMLSEKRVTLEAYASLHHLHYIEDESNFDHRYLRNAIRHRVMPVLQELSPGYAARIARSAQHFQSAQDLLLEVAEQDLTACSSDNGLRIDAMHGLSGGRRDNLFRYWFSKAGIRMPTTARLKEMQSQLFDGREDARITIHHDTVAIHRYRNAVFMSYRHQGDVTPSKGLEFIWQGEQSLHFPQFSGSLHFDVVEKGLDQAWLMRQHLNIHLRKGGERLKLAENRSTRDMKSHYQSLGIPFWQRESLPYVSIGKDLLFAAGVGMQSRFFRTDLDNKDDTSECIGLRWVFDQAGIV